MKLETSIFCTFKCEKVVVFLTNARKMFDHTCAKVSQVKLQPYKQMYELFFFFLNNCTRGNCRVGVTVKSNDKWVVSH